MAAKPQFESAKVTNIAGKSLPTYKKSGYAAADVPDSMMPTKPGLVEKHPYSGPNTVRITRG